MEDVYELSFSGVFVYPGLEMLSGRRIGLRSRDFAKDLLPVLGANAANGPRCTQANS